MCHCGNKGVSYISDFEHPDHQEAWDGVGTEIKCQQRVNSEEDNSPPMAARD